MTAGHRMSENRHTVARAEGAGNPLDTCGQVPPPPNETAGQVGAENHSRRARAETAAAPSLKTTKRLPSSPSPIAGHCPLENQSGRARAAEEAIDRLKTTPPFPPPPPAILELIDLQRQRIHAIKAQSFGDRTCDSYVAHFLGYHAGLPEAARKTLFKQAADMRANVEKQLKKDQKAGGQAEPENQQTGAPGPDGEGHSTFENQTGNALAGPDRERHSRPANQPDGALSVCRPIILNTILSRAGWDTLRKTTEVRMCATAGQFPVLERAAAVAGFAELGLAVILAEAGNDLTAFPHPMHLWKRLGLAPYKGRAMSQWHGKDLTAGEWSEQGYNGNRLGRIVGVAGTPLFLAKDRPGGYGAVYAARRAHTALTHPDWTKAHSDNDARRIMLKAFIADLWRWWKAAARAADVSQAA